MGSGIVKIFGKQTDEIEERIERVENGLMEVDYKDGLTITFSGEKTSIIDRIRFYRVPGISISVVDSYELEWAKSFGVKDVRARDSVTTDIPFEAGSTSKALTATATLNFVERESLDLDESLNERLLTWKIPDSKYTRRTKISLRHLLTHTSGINRLTVVLT